MKSHGGSPLSWSPFRWRARTRMNKRSTRSGVAKYTLRVVRITRRRGTPAVALIHSARPTSAAPPPAQKLDRTSVASRPLAIHHSDQRSVLFVGGISGNGCSSFGRYSQCHGSDLTVRLKPWMGAFLTIQRYSSVSRHAIFTLPTAHTASEFDQRSAAYDDARSGIEKIFSRPGPGSPLI